LSDAGYQNQQDYLGEITAREHADHSVPYTVARALLDGEVKVDDFEESRFRDPRALGLVKKVTLRSEASLTSPNQEALGAHLDVRLRNGTVLRAEVPHPPGSLRNPADEEGLVKKFLALSENVLGKQRARRATEVILSVEALSDLSDLLNVISSPAKPG